MTRLHQLRWMGGYAVVLIGVGCTVYDPGLIDRRGERDSRSPSDGSTGGDGDAGGERDGGRDGGDDADMPTPGSGCGDGQVGSGEKCDTGIAAGQPGACPSECPALGDCAPRALNGTGCHAECVLLPASCEGGDGCCPPECTPQNDDDCSASCGDGVVEPDEGETCEPDSDTPCPSAADCDDMDACTDDMLLGSDQNCNARCENTPFTDAKPNDGCCPAGANANTDSDCSPVCGNAVREGDEECDGEPGCDDQCIQGPTPDQQRCLDDFASDECERCACISCTTELFACLDDADSTAVMQCESVVDCARTVDCVGNACYCGTADLATCGSGGGNGECRSEIEAVAQAVSGESDALTIQNLSSMPTNPLGRAMALGNCSVANCPSHCP